jgi:hypothetical protein
MSQAVYNAIVADIYALTGRPDLVTETAIAVRKATMKFHLAETWPADLAIITPTVPGVVGTDTSVRYTLDLTDTATYPRFRKIAYIKEYNNPLTGSEIQFNPLDIDRVLDGYGLEEVNYYSQAGQSVSIRATKLMTQLTVGYYKYPDIIAATYTSWISDQFPDAIVEEAAAAVFKTIGKDSEYQRYSQAFNDNLHMLQIGQL